MRHAAVIALLLAITSCANARASAPHQSDEGASRRGPFVWRGTSGDAATDTANGIINAALTAATSEDPAVPLCTPESADPPHTCPAKAGEEPRAGAEPR